MALAGGALAIASGASGIDTPRWLWLTLVIGGVVLAQAQVARAIHDPEDRPELTERVVEAPRRTAAIENASPPEAEDATATPSAPSPADPTVVLQPELLQGRIYPYMQNPVVQTTERALPVRVAAAAAIPQNLVAEIDGRAHDVFENAVATSLLERWILAMTTRGRPDLNHYWEPVDPARTWISTLRRPPARLEKGWTLDAQAAVSVRPTQTPGTAQWLTIILDAVVREGDDGAKFGRPLSFEDLYQLVCVMTSAVLDEIAPPTAAAVAGGYRLLSFAAVITPTGTSFSNFVPLDQIDGQRAQGSGDVSGAEWAPRSLAEIATADMRAVAIRQWFKRIVRDSGFIRGYEDEIERLAPRLHLPQPPE
jgi:hypothetical protein